jgi:hypothetical protein
LSSSCLLASESDNLNSNTLSSELFFLRREAAILTGEK